MEFANQIIETIESHEHVETKKNGQFLDECFAFVVRFTAIAAVTFATLTTLAIAF